jgi:radical SAM superfamily enzyme YgiQ (UPF0313 family)
MAAQAREAGVKEVWAGNFGAYSPHVANSFDRVFQGWSENTVSEALGLPAISPERLQHPEIYGAIGCNLFPRMILSGILFTSRGCPWTCNFCQTPDFYGKAQQVPLDAIDRILRQYKKRGVTSINILDENFGTFRKHSRDVVDLLHRYGMRWIALTRVDTLLKDFDYWYEHGFFGAHIGIESLNQDSLIDASKRINQLDSIRLLKNMSRHNMFLQCFYILGFESDTVESIRNDVEVLAKLDIDIVQIQVLTPYPRTEHRTMIENRFGIYDKNLSKYNSRNLVWNHPNITPDQMKSLQLWANKKLTSSRRALRTISKFAVFSGKKNPNLDGLKLLYRNFRQPLSKLHNAYGDNLLAARLWGKTGWYPYEEVDNTSSLTAISQDTGDSTVWKKPLY